MTITLSDPSLLESVTPSLSLTRFSAQYPKAVYAELSNLYNNDIQSMPNINLALIADDTTIMVRHSQPHIV